MLLSRRIVSLAVCYLAVLGVSRLATAQVIPGDGDPQSCRDLSYQDCAVNCDYQSNSWCPNVPHPTIPEATCHGSLVCPVDVCVILFTQFRCNYTIHTP